MSCRDNARSWQAITFSMIVSSFYLCNVHSFLLCPSIHSSNKLNIHPKSLSRNGNGSCLLSMSLKPAAIPLMDSGKALARSGELIIDLTSSMNLYGGGLSAAGAQIRNSGDCIAQAAASCRFKTATELVCDELREAATCLGEATDKLKLAVSEAQADKNDELARNLDAIVTNCSTCAETLEAAGAGIMLRQSLKQIGSKLVDCGNTFQALSMQIPALGEKQSADGLENASVAGQRMAFAAEKMMEAGNNLVGEEKPKPKGKAWLKG